MRPADLTMKRGDTRPDVILEPLDENGDLVDVENPPLGPLGTLEFHLRGAGDTTELTLTGVASVVGGRFRFRWSAADTADLAGEYRGEFEATYADGGRETFPNGRDLKIVFSEDVETGAEP